MIQADLDAFDLNSYYYLATFAPTQGKTHRISILRILSSTNDVLPWADEHTVILYEQEKHCFCHAVVKKPSSVRAWVLPNEENGANPLENHLWICETGSLRYYYLLRNT